MAAGGDSDSGRKIIRVRGLVHEMELDDTGGGSQRISLVLVQGDVRASIPLSDRGAEVFLGAFGEVLGATRNVDALPEKAPDLSVAPELEEPPFGEGGERQDSETDGDNGGGGDGGWSPVGADGTPVADSPRAVAPRERQRVPVTGQAHEIAPELFEDLVPAQGGQESLEYPESADGFDLGSAGDWTDVRDK